MSTQPTQPTTSQGTQRSLGTGTNTQRTNQIATTSPARTDLPSEELDPFSDNDADEDAEIGDAEDVQLDEEAGYRQLQE